MVPFGKQQDILRDLSCVKPRKICQETAERLLIEDGVVVITSVLHLCLSSTSHFSRDLQGAVREAETPVESEDPTG
jgi:hypothetical protein